MEEKTSPLPRLAAEKGMELLSIIVMLYAALGSVRMFFGVPVSIPLVLVLCFLYGCIYIAGVLLGQQKLSFAVLTGAVVLAFFVLYQMELGIEATVAPMGYLLLLLIHSLDWPQRGFALGIAVCVVLGFIWGYELPKLLIAAAVFLLLKELTAFYGNRFAVQLLPLLLGVALVVFAIPIHDEPFDWSFVVRFGDSMVGLARSAAREMGYFFSAPDGIPGLLVGYSGQGSMEGSLFDNDLEELYLSVKSTRGNLYLKGQDYGLLDGETWGEATASTQPYGLWYAQFLNALIAEDISKEKAGTFAEVCTTELTYGYLKTTDVIRPAGLLYLTKDLLADMTDNPNEFNYRDTKQRSYKYSVRFMDFDYANPYLQELFTKLPQQSTAQMASYEELTEISRTYFSVELGMVFSRSEYAQYAAKRLEAEANGEPDPIIAEVMEETLSVSGVTNRVRELSAAVTEGCASDYEKAKAIEDYLRNYSYSTKTDLRGSDSFIDEFLFETRAGYCAHYASAMVMMLRLNGIPARLTEGYCADYSHRESGRGFVVYGSSAHIWPEAYLEGFGWVRFEPTASMPSAETLGWGLRLRTVTEKPDLAEKYAHSGYERPAPPTPEELLGEFEPTEPELKEENPLVLLTRSLALILALAFAALFALYLANKKLPYRFKGEGERLKALLDDLCWLIRALHPGDWKNRPLLDYAAAMDDTDLRKDVQAAFLLHYRLRYRDAAPTKEEWEALAQVRKKVYTLYLSEAGAKRRRAQVLAFLNCRAGF